MRDLLDAAVLINPILRRARFTIAPVSGISNPNRFTDYSPSGDLRISVLPHWLIAGCIDRCTVACALFMGRFGVYFGLEVDMGGDDSDLRFTARLDGRGHLRPSVVLTVLYRFRAPFGSLSHFWLMPRWRFTDGALGGPARSENRFSWYRAF